jgi:hypothetical protein
MPDRTLIKNVSSEAIMEITWVQYSVFYIKCKEGMEGSKTKFFDVDKIGHNKMKAYSDYLKATPGYCLELILKEGWKETRDQKFLCYVDPSTYEAGEAFPEPPKQ